MENKNPYERTRISKHEGVIHCGTVVHVGESNASEDTKRHDKYKKERHIDIHRKIKIGDGMVSKLRGSVPYMIYGPHLH